MLAKKPIWIWDQTKAGARMWRYHVKYRVASRIKKGINMKIEKNNFVVTFKTEKEVSDYMGMHIPEEQRLLWLGFFIANNYIAQRLEDDGVELVKK